MRNKSYFRYFVLKTLLQALYLEIKPLKSALGLLGEIPKIAITQKALNRNHRNIRQRYLFYASCCYFFSLQSIAQGNCDLNSGTIFDYNMFIHAQLCMYLFS